jgi:hypothetical protein
VCCGKVYVHFTEPVSFGVKQLVCFVFRGGEITYVLCTFSTVFGKMAVDLELLTLFDGESSQVTGIISEAISDALLRTMGALAEHNRREMWVQECQTRLKDILPYACHFLLFSSTFLFPTMQKRKNYRLLYFFNRKTLGRDSARKLIRLAREKLGQTVDEDESDYYDEDAGVEEREEESQHVIDDGNISEYLAFSLFVQC